MAKHRVKVQTSTKVCPKCSAEKELTDFGRDASRPDGRYTYCKACRHTPSRKDKIVLELASKGLKSCTLCLKVKPFSAFEKDSSKSLGVTSRCKKCKSEQRRKKAAEWHLRKAHLNELERGGWTQCYRCDEVKPLHNFLKNANYQTGYSRLCLACNNDIRKGYRDHRNKSSRDYTRWEVFEDDHFTCYLCEDVLLDTTPSSDSKSLSIDHVIPISKGGLDERSNVRTACLECNRKKSDTFLEEFILRMGA